MTALSIRDDKHRVNCRHAPHNPQHRNHRNKPNDPVTGALPAGTACGGR